MTEQRPLKDIRDDLTEAVALVNQRLSEAAQAGIDVEIHDLDVTEMRWPVRGHLLRVSLSINLDRWASLPESVRQT